MGRTLKALQKIEAESAWPSAPDAEAALSRAEAAAAMAADEFSDGGPAHAERAAVEPEAEPSRDGAVAWPQPPSAKHAEACGRLAQKVLSQLPPKGPASLVFTSPGDAAGTTGLLVSLAEALAQRVSGNVLLVDGNCRHPSLADHLAIDVADGWADVLSGTVPWQQAIRTTSVPRLHVLPGAGAVADENWLSQTRRFSRLLRDLCRSYRLVLVDAASLAYPEVAPAARHCTGAYLAIRLSRTTRRAAREAVEVIDAGGGRLLGCVVLEGY